MTNRNHSYGRKGGEGPTSGRKAETLTFTIPGVVLRKRVFFGQRWASVVQRDEYDTPQLCPFHTEEEAQNHAESVCRSLGYLVGFAVHADQS